MQLTIQPHITPDDEETFITFESDARDAATLIHAYATATPLCHSHTLTRGPRTITITRERILPVSSVPFTNAINYLFPDDSY